MKARLMRRCFTNFGFAVAVWLLLLALPVAGLAAAVATAVNAHFKLVEPAAWLEQDDRGDPQKLAPCGGTLADPGEPTNAVTATAAARSAGGEAARIIAIPAAAASSASDGPIGMMKRSARCEVMP